MEEEVVAGPSSALPGMSITFKLDHKHVDEKLQREEFGYAPPRENAKRRIERRKTLHAVAESPMSPAPHERGPSLETPSVESVETGFRASYHIHNSLPDANVSTSRCTSCIVCRMSVDAINKAKAVWYMDKYPQRRARVNHKVEERSI